MRKGERKTRERVCLLSVFMYVCVCMCVYIYIYLGGGPLVFSVHFDKFRAKHALDAAGLRELLQGICACVFV